MENQLIIQNIHIDNLTQNEFFNIFRSYKKQPQKRIIFFANAHVINVAVKDSDFLSSLQSADLVLPDGIGVRIAGKLLGNPIKENLNGTDLLPKILKYAEENRMSIFLLGAEEKVINLAATRMKKTFANLNIVGQHHGYLNHHSNQRLLTLINSLSPDILLVGMGNPLQEKWICQFSTQLKVKYFFGVGAFFDFMAEKFPRAPQIIRKLGLEWGYRLWKEPFRLYKRYLYGNPLFLYFAIKQAFKESIRLT